MSTIYCKNGMFRGITISLTRRKIQKCQQHLGNGHDAELYLTIADLYRYIQEDSLALESYRSAARSLLKKTTSGDTERSNQLIKIYKNILSLTPLDDETAHKLGQEYQRRGMHYRAVSIHTAFAEHYTQHGEYTKAISHYQRIFEIEPGSILARQACAELYCRIGEHEQGAREYTQIGDIHFDHQKFEGALRFYQQASEIYPDDDDIKQKILMTRQILEGTNIPQVQMSFQKLSHMSHLKRSLAEKERIERELRYNICQLKQQYQRSVSLKDSQLEATQQRLEELSIYVALLKDDLEQIEAGKQHLTKQLEQELTRKKDLEQKLAALNVHSDGRHLAGDAHLGESDGRRLEGGAHLSESDGCHLESDAHLLQAQLKHSSQRESQLRNDLAEQTFKGKTLEQQLTTTNQEREQVDLKLQDQLQKSLQREQELREQMKKLIQQHKCVLKQVKQERRVYKKKYRVTQTRMSVMEKHTITTLEQLHSELSRQCAVESSFSKKFHKSLQEIAMLLHNQEQEIQKLECL